MCCAWTNRDVNAVRLKRQLETYSKLGVTNAMQIPSAIAKHHSTTKQRYGAESVFSSESSLFGKVQAKNARQRAVNAYEKKVQTKRRTVTVKQFNFSDLKFGKCEWDKAINFLDEHHYAGHGRGPKAVYCLTFGSEIVCVMKFSSVVRLEVATSMGMAPSSVMELDRMCIHPKYQKKNLASHALSQTVRAIRANFPNVTTLVSFADTAQGHSGTIYIASGWECVGKTRESYVYINADGNPTNKKSVYNRACRIGTTEADMAQKLSLIKVPLPPKIKFRIDL